MSQIGTYQIGEDVFVSWLANDHPGTSFSYRIEHQGKVVVFSTDAEYKDISFNAMSPVIEFFKDADVLIFDAQYVFTDAVQMKRDWGHSSSFVGIDLALDAEVDTLLLVPSRPDAHRRHASPKPQPSASVPHQYGARFQAEH